MDEEYRVEVELNDADHGYSLRERLRALDLDDKARELLGRGVVVTRDGSRLFLYAPTEPQARGAERIVGDLALAEGVTADVRVTRWHDVEEAWKDASVPLPSSPEEVDAERRAHEAAEIAEAATDGEYDWTLAVHFPSRRGALDLARRLASEGYPVTHRWRYVLIGAATEDAANDLAAELRASLADDVDVRVEVDLSDLARSPLQFLSF